MAAEKSLQVLYADRSDDPDSKFFGSGRSVVTRIGEIQPATLATNLSQVCAALEGVLDEVQSRDSGFRLSSFQVTVELTGSGEVRLVGAVSVEVKGGITLTFDRRDTPE